MYPGISTIKRFLYLNIYALLLFFVGVGVLCVPIWKKCLWLGIIQIVFSFLFLRGAYGIFASWNDKKRKYNVLMERNKNNIREDTFQEYMQAPCGRLLVKIVLEDLHKQYMYHTLLKYRHPFWKQIIKNARVNSTSVYINPKYLKNGTKEN